MRDEFLGRFRCGDKLIFTGYLGREFFFIKPIGIKIFPKEIEAGSKQERE